MRHQPSLPARHNHDDHLHDDYHPNDDDNQGDDDYGRKYHHHDPRPDHHNPGPDHDVGDAGAGHYDGARRSRGDRTHRQYIGRGFDHPR